MADMRDTASKGLEKAGGALGTLLETARKGVASLQSATNTTDLPASQALQRGLLFAEQNVAAAFEQAQKLVQTTDFKEAVKLQTDYVKDQFAAMKAQAEELTGMAKTEASAAAEGVAETAAAATGPTAKPDAPEKPAKAEKAPKNPSA